MMTDFPLGAMAALILVASAPFARADQGVLRQGCPTGQSFAAGSITVTGAYLRATAPGARSAGAYLTIANTGSAPDTFTGAATAAATDATLHQMKMNGQVMEMAPIEGGLPIPPGGSVSLDPMSYHLMLTGLSQPFVEGQCVAMTLHFAGAGDLPIELNIGSLSQSAPPAGETDGVSIMPPGEMDMSSMQPGM